MIVNKRTNGGSNEAEGKEFYNNKRGVVCLSSCSPCACGATLFIIRADRAFNLIYFFLPYFLSFTFLFC